MVLARPFPPLQWYLCGKLVDVQDATPATMAARVVVFAYGLLVIIMLALFTANTAAQVRLHLLQLTDAASLLPCGRCLLHLWPLLPLLAHSLGILTYYTCALCRSRRAAWLGRLRARMT